MIPITGEYSKETNTFTIKGETGVRTFVRIIVSLGYGDMDSATAEYQGHALCVMGKQADDRLNIIGEGIGRPSELAATLVEWKDVVGVKDIYLPAEPNRFFLEYADQDGLTQYRTYGKGRDGKPLYRTSLFKTFVSVDHTATLAPIPDAMLAEYPAHLAAYQSAVITGKVIIADWCPRAMSLSREGRRAITHPLAQAMVYAYAIHEIEAKAQITVTKKEAANVWYGNRL